jgi:hypothetical protein
MEIGMDDSECKEIEILNRALEAIEREMCGNDIPFAIVNARANLIEEIKILASGRMNRGLAVIKYHELYIAKGLWVKAATIICRAISGYSSLTSLYNLIEDAERALTLSENCLEAFEILGLDPAKHSLAPLVDECAGEYPNETLEQSVERVRSAHLKWAALPTEMRTKTSKKKATLSIDKVIGRVAAQISGVVGSNSTRDRVSIIDDILAQIRAKLIAEFEAPTAGESHEAVEASPESDSSLTPVAPSEPPPPDPSQLAVDPQRAPTMTQARSLRTGFVPAESHRLRIMEFPS